jgi:hypothetical protein
MLIFHIPGSFYIYDIFYNDLNEFIVLSAPGIDETINLFINNQPFQTQRYICGHGHTTVHKLANQEYVEYVDICVPKYNVTIKARVNRYPCYKDEIVLSTMVKNEDNYIIQWIEYYKMLGVQHFVVYDNKNGDKSKFHDYFVESKDKDSNLRLVLEKYIQQGDVLLIDWPFDFKFQMSQQTHSIQAFKQSKWIGLLDVDEYINIKTEDCTLGSLFDRSIGAFDKDNIGGFMILSKFFHNPDKIPETGYNFLSCYNCGDILFNIYEKLFVNPKAVENFSCHRITNGCDHILLDHNQISINHYFFLNKLDRGKTQLPNYDDSIKVHVKNLIQKMKSDS